jgi:hypothetical protein
VNSFSADARPNVSRISTPVNPAVLVKRSRRVPGLHQRCTGLGGSRPLLNTGHGASNLDCDWSSSACRAFGAAWFIGGPNLLYVSVTNLCSDSSESGDQDGRNRSDGYGRGRHHVTRTPRGLRGDLAAQRTAVSCCVSACPRRGANAQRHVVSRPSAPRTANRHFRK